MVGEFGLICPKISNAMKTKKQMLNCAVYSQTTFSPHSKNGWVKKTKKKQNPLATPCWINIGQKTCWLK